MDTIKALFTYAIAFVIVVGGGYVLLVTGGNADFSDTRVVVAGFMGTALAFVFGRETQTQTARQVNTANANGASGSH